MKTNITKKFRQLATVMGMVAVVAGGVQETQAKGVSYKVSQGSAARGVAVVEPVVESMDVPVLTKGIVQTRVVTAEAARTKASARNVGEEVTASLYWEAPAAGEVAETLAQSQSFDLIYWDADSFDENEDNVWNRLATVDEPWGTDSEGALLADGTLRFYRVSYKDQWQRADPETGTARTPKASVEVYSMNNVILSEGFNGVSLQGVPYTNTFAGVFGTDTDMWPAADSAAAGATTIEFYTSGTSVGVAEAYFFGSDGQWYNVDTANHPEPVTDLLQDENFFTRAFSINLPNPLPDRFVTTSALYKDTAVRAMVWHPLLQVPTQTVGGSQVFTREITAGKYTRGSSSSAYNLIALNLPVAVHPSQLNLVESGFVRSNDAGRGDVFYIIDTHTKSIRGDSSIYCDASNIWRFSGTKQAIPSDYSVQPNDMIVLISRNAPSAEYATGDQAWTWSYSPSDFYTLPTSHMAE